MPCRFTNRADIFGANRPLPLSSVFRWFLRVMFFTSILPTVPASGEAMVPFADGRWHGEATDSPVPSKLAGCWAATVLDDGTSLVLVKETDGSWSLQLSNRNWRLPLSRRYALAVVVDFYPRLLVVGEIRYPTRLEVRAIDRVPLLDFIENGHMIKLQHNGFEKRYDLEGSAKAIERIRGCKSD